MKLNKLTVLSVLGVISSVGISLAEPCILEPVPCMGPQTENGYGCQTGCPPQDPDLGCCSYVEYRVNCDEGPDQFYRTHQCHIVQNCTSIVIPKKFECTHL